MDSDFTEVEPIERASTLPAKAYRDPSVLQTEIQKILKSSWQYVGPSVMFEKSGVAVPLEVLGVPLAMVRDRAGILRCLSNVCRHRGGPILKETSEEVRVLRCKYHSWTYSLDGQLIGSPSFDGVENFDRAGCRLPQYEVSEFEGMVFCRLTSGSTQSLEDYLGDISREVFPIQLGQMKFLKRIVYPVRANWKVYIDNYMEGYHIDAVHPKLAKILSMDGYTTTSEKHFVLQKGPLVSDQNPYHTSGHAFYYQVFPNLMFNIMPSRMQVNTVIPRGVSNCDVVFDFYLKDSDADAQEKRLADDIEVSTLVQAEDAEICEYVQRGLESGEYQRGRYSVSQEVGLWHFHKQMREAYKNIFKKI